jgi:hypothetical protein
MCGVIRPGTRPKTASSGTSVAGSNWRNQAVNGRNIFSRRAKVARSPWPALAWRAQSAISSTVSGPSWLTWAT